jgi:hypothetical protein
MDNEEYSYKFNLNFDYSNTDLTTHRIMLVEKFCIRETAAFIREKFNSNSNNYEIYENKLDFTVVTKDKKKLKDISTFCNKLKELDVLFHSLVKWGSRIKLENQVEIRELLTKIYDNHILNKELNEQLSINKNGSKKIKL